MFGTTKQSVNTTIFSCWTLLLRVGCFIFRREKGKMKKKCEKRRADGVSFSVKLKYTNGRRGGRRWCARVHRIGGQTALDAVRSNTGSSDKLRPPRLPCPSSLHPEFIFFLSHSPLPRGFLHPALRYRRRPRVAHVPQQLDLSVRP